MRLLFFKLITILITFNNVLAVPVANNGSINVAITWPAMNTSLGLDANLTNLARCVEFNYNQATGVNQTTTVYLSGETVVVSVNDPGKAFDIAEKMLKTCIKIHYPGTSCGLVMIPGDYDNDLVMIGDSHRVTLPNDGGLNTGFSKRGTSSQRGHDPLPVRNHDKTRRTKYHDFFIMRLSDDKDSCASNDETYPATDICNQVKSPYESFQIENRCPDGQWLQVTVWPHHDCPQYQDSRSYMIAPNAITDCIHRRTYSWFGACQEDECYNNEDSVDCSSALISKTVNMVFNGANVYRQAYYYGLWVWFNVGTGKIIG